MMKEREGASQKARKSASPEALHAAISGYDSMKITRFNETYHAALGGAVQALSNKSGRGGNQVRQDGAGAQREQGRNK